MKLSRFSTSLSSLVLWLGMGACTTSSSTTIVQIGDSSHAVKKNAFAELEKSDWKPVNMDTHCVTHLYRCTIDEKGSILLNKSLIYLDKSMLYA